MEKTLFYSGKREGIAEGRAEGIAEGEHNKQIEIARKMKAHGLSPAEIAQLTGLEEPEITGL